MRRPRRRRLDLLLVDAGLAPTRARAQALIMAGRVRCEGERMDKPGRQVPAHADVRVDPGPRYVSRGGHKLAGALRCLRVEVAGRPAMDVGASAGGFTQVLLEAGAARVAAIDVGRGQLAWELRVDPRVAVVEGVNARHLEPAMLPFVPELAVVDVSFISLTLVLPPVVGCLAPGGEVVALVKPQFEAGRGKVDKGGIVRDPRLRREVLHRLAGFVREREWAMRGVLTSPLRGAEGNVEFFVHLRPTGPGLGARELDVAIDNALADGPGEERSSGRP